MKLFEKLLVVTLAIGVGSLPGCSPGPSPPKVGLSVLSGVSPTTTGDWIWVANSRYDWPETRMRTFIYQIPKAPSEVYASAIADFSKRDKFVIGADRSFSKNLNSINFYEVDPATKKAIFGPGIYILLAAGKCDDPRKGIYQPGTKDSWTSIQINVPFGK